MWSVCTLVGSFLAAAAMIPILTTACGPDDWYYCKSFLCYLALVGSDLRTPAPDVLSLAEKVAYISQAAQLPGYLDSLEPVLSMTLFGLQCYASDNFVDWCVQVQSSKSLFSVLTLPSMRWLCV